MTEDDTGGVTKLTRSGIVLGIIVAAIVVIVAVALVLALRGPEQLEPGTPEATVQGYLQAVIDEDPTAVAGFLTADLAKRCASDLDQVRFHPDSFKAVIADTRPSRDQMFITVEITEGSGASVFSDSYTFDEILVLEKTSGTWSIAEVPWPIYCREV